MLDINQIVNSEIKPTRRGRKKW